MSIINDFLWKKKEKNMNPFLIYLQEKKTLEHGT